MTKEMTAINLQYNVAIELVLAFFTWSSWERLEKTTRFEQVPQDIREWKGGLDRIFSVYYREQANPLASEFLLIIFSLLKAIVINSLSTPIELLNYLSRCSGEEFAEMVVKGEEFPFTLGELLDNPQKGKEALCHSHGTVRVGEDERFIDFLGHPDYYRMKLHTHLLEFYEKGFAPYQNRITLRMKHILKSEKQAAIENPKSFLESRLFFKMEDNIDNVPSVIFISYYDCIDCLIQDKPSLATYGWLNKDSTPELDIEEIYSLINDETRRNILKGLAKRAMFSREIADIWNLAPSTVSYHMSRFYMLGLINHRSGSRKRIYHELNKDRLNQLLDLIKADLSGTEI